MRKLAKLQLIGPLVVAFAVATEEVATYWLAAKPSSALAWYFNLEVFGIFQHGHYVLNHYFSVAYLQLLYVAAPILLLSLGGYALRARLPVAIASNLSFAYAFFLTYAWLSVRMQAPQAASLNGGVFDTVFNFSAINLASGPHCYVLAALLIASLLSSTASHLVYLRAVRGV